MSLDSFFNPRSIALIGASHSEKKLGGIVLKNLLRFKGKIYPVNPKYPELMGLKSYPSVYEIPSVDLVLVLRPAPEVPDIIRELKGKTESVIVMSSGFAEAGEPELQEQVGKIGKESGIRIIGPNCMGIYNPHRKLDTYFLSYDRLRRPKKGNVAIVSQSGAVLTYLLGAMNTSNIGVSKAMTYGNAVDINEADMYDYLAEDEYTDVVLSYVESVIDGRRFVDKAVRLSGRKPFIVLKSGKSSGGSAAAFSHTGRLAGRYEVFSSILKQFGIKEAAGVDELIDSAKAISYQRPAKGVRVLIVTNGGGSGVLASDECVKQGLEAAGLLKDKKERLKKIFPHFYSVSNPFDLTAQVLDDDYITVLDELRDDYDGFLVIALPNVIGITERLGPLLKSFRDKAQKPLVAHVSQSGITKRLVPFLETSKIPVYSSPERAIRGLKALLEK